MNNTNEAYSSNAQSGEKILIAAACKDTRFLCALKSEFQRIGVDLCEYNGADAPAVLLVDADDYPSLAEGLGGCVAAVAWTRSRDLDAINSRGEYAAVFHRPFLMDELLLRVLSILRDQGILERLVSDRYGSLSSGALPAVGDAFAPANAAVRSIAVSESRHSVTVGGESVGLSPKEWSVFKYLFDRRGTAVSREALAEHIGADGGANTVDVHVCHLREKIENRVGAKVFYTVRGVGYKMK